MNDKTVNITYLTDTGLDLPDGLELHRPDLKIIQEMIPEGASVLDLGCGSGRLLKVLSMQKKARVMGVEIAQKKVLECVSRGVPVIQADLNADLFTIASGSFDYVVLSYTLQAVDRPDFVLAEMLRIGKHGIVSFINFGQFDARMQFLRGNMPVTEKLPLPWYDTPNIHPSTIADFRMLCRRKNITIVKEIPLSQKGDTFGRFANLWPNLFASTCIFVLGK